MTENNESSNRLDRLERLMEQQIINTADLTQQIKEIPQKPTGTERLNRKTRVFNSHRRPLKKLFIS